MYCSKCGKEITQNMKFCAHCGEKISVNEANIEKIYVSVCSKCGQNTDNGMKFCTRCGGEIIKKETYLTPNRNFAPAVTGLNGNNVAENSIGFIGAILLGILAIVYLIVAIVGYNGNSAAFEFVGIGYKTLGMLFHWGICAIAIVSCSKCVVQVMTSTTKGNCLIRTSVFMLVFTSILWIGSIIWGDFDFDGITIVLYRIFGTYGKIILISFMILIITLICGVLCSKSEQQ